MAATTSPLNFSVPCKPNRALRVAVVCDFAEERWPSMDLVGNMLHASLTERWSRVNSSLIRPRMPLAFRSHPHKISRVIGRFVHYPRELRRIRHQFDIFHIVDHSYAHLAHELPAERTVVTCHDIDAFRCLIDPASNRSVLFRALARRVLTGMQRAAHVTCVSETTRQGLLAQGLMPSEKLSVVYNGVHPALKAEPDPKADAELSRILGRDPGRSLEIIHVGSTIARKRIDVLFKVFAALRQNRDLRLLRVGGNFTPQQRDLARSLGIVDHIDVLPRLNVQLLAAAYRRAAILLLTSESEGFGLPVTEAMACGTPVVASDLPALREIAGTAANYCPKGDSSRFAQEVLSLLQQREEDPIEWQKRRDSSRAQVRQFTWPAYASRILEIYSQMVDA